jgi:paraquat-inducible protein B
MDIKQQRVYAVIKFRNGKEAHKRVHPRSIWLYPLIAMIITGIIMLIVMFSIPEWIIKLLLT